MFNENMLTWKQYENIRDKYSHIASFAYWPKWHKGNKAEPLIVRSEDEFNERLLNKIHCNAVIVGFNYGINDDIEKIIDDNSLNGEQQVTELKKSMYFSNQYGGSYGKKALNEAFKGTFVEGAYMTDLFKFKLSEKNWEGTGMPTAKGSEFKKRLKEKPEKIEFNIKGLRYELYNVAEIKQDPIFIFLGEGLFDDEIMSLINVSFPKYFPNSKIYIFSHYQRRGYKKEDFIFEAENLLKRIKSDYGDSF
ncbi:hypothetical protein [Anaerosphaera multitolerans]|uniref:Uncharacterized protein n=1 Tax=Anaerosphaera multitolerans TaxID=2487351 RepID=A0A437S8M5_9FIRM|nr:hypothetical protein [Anaerosphaera multitolerans]RVU55450.1 hypothetical protein EF514_01600 [Anaerosphaera multitolerans]